MIFVHLFNAQFPGKIVVTICVVMIYVQLNFV